ncbi:MAG: transglutaminaseTgpA domain-containing protein [Vulcanimicrobiota bacterium]
MFKAWIRFLKSLKRVPEDSAHFRAWVAINVSVALVATAEQLDWPMFFWPCLALTWFGMWLSHRLRRRNNWEIKAALSVLMVVALVNFFSGLAHSYYDPREPLAQLLMWLQALHSCDLPTRKDLSYSLLSALILMAVGAVLSISFSFAIYLLVYYFSAVIALRWNVRSLVGERTGWRPASGRALPSWRGGLGLGLSVLGCGLLVVMLMPRLEGFRIRALPMSWQNRLEQANESKGEVQNPYYPAQLSKEQMKKESHFNSSGYGGFSSLVDLQTRGKLSHERVFQVRTNVECYFRGLTFDTYDGQFWSQSEEELQTLNVPSPPFTFMPPSSNATDVVQIFYIDRPLSNLVLFSPDAYQVFFPSQILYQDRAGCLRAPFVLDKELVYSVVSRQSHMSARRLSRLPRRDPELRKLTNYLQLPESLPPRVVELSRKIVAGRNGYYDRAAALAIYLSSNYTYDLDIPRFAEEHDAVDSFLFESKRGYCEHFAAAMTVMCRTLKIPARYCTGFLPGTYNPFSGFREVYGDQAHAWVEVYIPGYGWMTFDPTPGGSLTPEVNAGSAPQSRWLGLAVLEYLGDKLGVSASRLAIWLVGLGLGLLAVAGLRALAPRPRLDPIQAALLEAWRLLGPSPPGHSPRQRAAAHCFESLRRLVELHEMVAYAGRPATAVEHRRARDLLAELRSELKGAGQPAKENPVP